MESKKIEFVIIEDMTSVFCKFITETNKALCFKSPITNSIEWIPFSLLSDETELNDITDYCFLINKRLAKTKNIIT